MVIMGMKPGDAPGVTSAVTISGNARTIAMGVIPQIKSSVEDMFLRNFTGLINPARKAPAAVSSIHDPMHSPMISSLPSKTPSNSRMKMIWTDMATIPSVKREMLFISGMPESWFIQI
jgi:hypothetical protein